MFIYNINILLLSQAQKCISLSVNLIEHDSCHMHEVIHTKNIINKILKDVILLSIDTYMWQWLEQ